MRFTLNIYTLLALLLLAGGIDAIWRGVTNKSTVSKAKYLTLAPWQEVLAGSAMLVVGAKILMASKRQDPPDPPTST